MASSKPSLFKRITGPFRSKDFQFTIKRVTDTFKLLFKNKMAVVGVFLLAVFIFMALAAPVISPTSPTQKVAGPLAQPAWVSYFPDGYYLSQNVVAPSTSAITSPASVQQWALAGPAASVANTQVSYAQGVKFIPGSAGSIQLSHTGKTQGTVSLSEMFYYPYHGPPSDFASHFHFLVTGANKTNPVIVQLYVTRFDTANTTETFILYNSNVTTNAPDTSQGSWLPLSTVILDTDNQAFVNSLNINTINFTPQQVIFSEKTYYTYGVNVTFTGRQTVNIDDFQMSIRGTSWGLLGTDSSGFDVYSQTIFGSRISLFVGLLSAGIGIGLGLLVGLLAGFLGRIVDEVLMRFTDMLLVIPGLPLLIVLVAVLGENIWNLIIIIGFLGWMGFARIIRAQVLTIRERPFIEAARASGAGPGRIISKHVFPNIVSLTYVNLALSVPAAIITQAALAFLGLSDPTVISWGNMFENIQISQALSRFPPVWWWVLPPGFAIALVSLSFILVGYALDEVFNPRLRRRR